MEFWYLFLFRLFSGVQNGLGYEKYKQLRTITSVIMMLVLQTTMIFFLRYNTYDWLCVIALISTGISMAGTWGVEDSFNLKYDFFSTDIHFWEILATGGITIAWVAIGGNIFLIAASVYPSLILHKAAINIISRLKDMPWREAFRYFLDHRTDDATGKTFNIPLLNIKIPRLSVRGRLILASISVIAAIVVHFTQWQLDIDQVIQMIGL